MKTTLSLLFVLLLSFAALGQIKDSAEYNFPQEDSEFVATFPTKPTLEMMNNYGKAAIAAEISTPSFYLRIESMKLSEKEAKSVAKMDDKTIGDFPLKFAAFWDLTPSTVQTGADKIGRYAKMRGSKIVDGNPATFEILYYFGKNEILTLCTGAAQDKYPAPEIKKFLESVRVNPVAPVSNADNTKGKKSNQVKDELLNMRAVDLPRPDYPAAARAVRASGAIQVQVKIDEDGNVLFARAISGHPLLRAGAENSARRARFTPAVLYGEKVKMTGTIVYNFVSS